MKMREALEIICDAERSRGFMVHFDRVEGKFLHGDHFPDKHGGEPLIPTEEDAWLMASAFAKRTRGRYVNIYVIDDRFCPVLGYAAKKIENR